MQAEFLIDYKVIKEVLADPSKADILQYTDEDGNTQGGYYAPDGLSGDLQDADMVNIVIISKPETIEELKTRDDFEFVEVLEE